MFVGDDMSVYDTTGKDYNEMEDKETLEKLTWELASQSGRITGQFSQCNGLVLLLLFFLTEC